MDQPFERDVMADLTPAISVSSADEFDQSDGMDEAEFAAEDAFEEGMHEFEVEGAVALTEDDFAESFTDNFEGDVWDDLSESEDGFNSENDEENHFTAENADSEFCYSELPDFACNDFIELGRFSCQGQVCAIVKLNQTHQPIEVDLATLLTERELQIAALVASGRANKQIANQLRISEWTVSTHLRRIFLKLVVDSRAAMVYRCASLIQELFGHEETLPKISESSTT